MADILTSLNDDQARLIACIGKPFLEYYRWPLWSYVEGEFDRDGLDARQILATLPEVNDTRSGASYGLVSYDHYNLTGRNTIRLTIGGLYHLATCDARALQVADDFIRVLKILIQCRLDAKPSLFELVEVKVTNEDIARLLPKLSQDFIAYLNDLLYHEPATMAGSSWHSTDGKEWSVTLQRRLLSYRGVETVVDYIERVTEILTPPPITHPEPAIPSPLELSATIDYFNVVWRLHIDKDPIIRLFGAERTARLVFDVGTADEFSAQVSAIVELLKNMRVPGQGRTPLQRLQNLLVERLPGDSRSRIEHAIAMLSDVADVRNSLFQHSGTEHRGVQALTNLGIAYPVTDWQLAWTTVQQRTIDAFNVLREEIQQFYESEPDLDS